MPILDVEIVGDYEPDHGVALKIADRAAVVLRVDEGQVWGKLRHVPRELYAENGRGDPCPDQPVFVTVTPWMREEKKLSPGCRGASQMSPGAFDVA